VQTLHEQDEVFIIVRGRGVLLHDGQRDPFEPGDFLWVAAGIEHQFEDFSDDLRVWRVFYGPKGGDVAAMVAKPRKAIARSEVPPSQADEGDHQCREEIARQRPTPPRR
jgi:mannose-6-phosphate isomerase-like protein (cupin superfamily)